MSFTKKSIPVIMFFALSALIMLTGVCSASTDAQDQGKKQDKLTTYKVEGKYKDQTAFVKIKMVDPDSLEVDVKDYVKFLTEAQIGDGLTIPMEAEHDFAKMKEIATAEALDDNEKAVQLKKAKSMYNDTIKAAKIKAKEKAKALYYKVWHQEYKEMDLPSATDGSTKTYMDYKTVTAKGTPQYALLNCDKAYTKDGFRMYDGYYCVALGSYYSKQIGTKFYITLSNGRTLRCILGDQKSDRHTDKKHQYAENNKDILEFIVDNIKLPGGDVSAIPGFEGSIVSIKRIIEPEIVIAGRTYNYEPDKGYVEGSKDKKNKKDKKKKKDNTRNKVNNTTETPEKPAVNRDESVEKEQKNVNTDQSETENTQEPAPPVNKDQEQSQGDVGGSNASPPESSGQASESGAQ